MIIFGYKTRPKVMAKFQYKCEKCKHKTIHTVIKVTYWFDLYFIPIIPFSSKMIVTCAACGSGGELSKEGKEKMEAMLENAKTEKLEHQDEK